MEDSRLRSPRVRTHCSPAQASSVVYDEPYTAVGCQSAEGDAEMDGAEVLAEASPSQLCLPLTDIPRL